MKSRKLKDKKYKLCAYLFKDNCSSWKDALKDSDRLTDYSIKDFGSKEMMLFVKDSFSNPPKWIGFFAGHLSDELEELFNSSSSAVLLVKQEKRIFAFTFGYGRNLLNLDVIEEAFGLKVALNSIDPDKIRSVDIKNLDTVVRHSKVQTSQVGSVDNFGMNIDRDILNAVTGFSNDTVLGKQISGSMSLHISVAIKIYELPELCSRLLEKYNDKTYTEYFPWVDHISDVKNNPLINELNDLLLAAIHNKEYESKSLFLAVPELVDWESVQGFKYKTSDKELREDIHIADVLPSDEEVKNNVNIRWLKMKKVYCMGADNDEIIESWPLYYCINYELEKDSASYLLHGGKWFKIDTDYVKSVSKEVTGIPEYTNYKFLEYQDRNEGEYNKRVYESDKKSCVLMDKKNISYGGGQSKIEFCDLYINKKDFAHVKRFRGSASLSHLFFQGLNSAFLVLTDSGFMKKVNNELPSGWKFDETHQLRAPEYEVVFAVISKVKKGVKDIFPFFSKVSLLQVYKQLRAYGYNVSIANIGTKKK
ncbi:MAG: TIGR04141 family sporadically distributed protein [Candidatus Thorarchaeota archaeon]